MRDRIVVGLCNFLLNTFASEEYLRMFKVTVILGLRELDKIAEHDNKQKD